MEWLNRLELITGDKIQSLKNKHVLILGLGGVGSYATEAIARSGIGTVTIVDNDVIDITNLNRQLMTTINNIGNKKTDEVEKRLLSINPLLNINKIDETIMPDNIKILFQGKIDYVIDACDTLVTKQSLIKECKVRRIKLISSMGTANKVDPSRLKIMDLSKTTYDPLAKRLRKFVKDERIKGKNIVVCSDEEGLKQKELGSTAFVPSTAGLLCASYVVNDILKGE